MESIYTELALYGSRNECARTNTVFLPISEVCDGKISLDKLTYIHEPLLKNHKNIMTNLYHIHLHLFTSTYEHGDTYE